MGFEKFTDEMRLVTDMNDAGQVECRLKEASERLSVLLKKTDLSPSEEEERGALIEQMEGLSKDKARLSAAFSQE